MNQSSTTRIVSINTSHVILWQFPRTSTRWLPPLLIGGGGDGGGAALDVLEVAGVAEKVAVQRVAAVALLVVQLYLAFLRAQQKRRCQKYMQGILSPLRSRKQINKSV